MSFGTFGCPTDGCQKHSGGHAEERKHSSSWQNPLFLRLNGTSTVFIYCMEERPLEFAHRRCCALMSGSR